MTSILKQSEWDNFFLNVAWEISKISPDPSTKVGAVLTSAEDNQMVSCGYNAFPRGVRETSKRWERPLKYAFVVHAERNAILNAARQGRSTLNTRLYLYYATGPCAQCVLDIIQAGVMEIVLGTVSFKGVGNGKYYDTDVNAPTMLKEAGINVRYVTDWVPKS